MSGDANIGKDNIMNPLENELVMNNLGDEKKITRMEIQSDRRAG